MLLYIEDNKIWWLITILFTNSPEEVGKVHTKLTSRYYLNISTFVLILWQDTLNIIMFKSDLVF